MLATMDIPAMRRDTTKEENRRWLLRNIAINNADNPHLDEAISILRSLTR